MRLAPLALLAVVPLCAQERYYPTAKDAVNCPREKAVDEDVVRGGPTSRPMPGTNTGGSTAVSNVSAVASGRPAESAASADSASPKTMEGAGSFPSDGKPYIFPIAHRKSVGDFTVMDREGKTTRVSDRKGKMLIIGFWATTCQASGVELLELADLQAKGEKYGFEVWPVNYDPVDRQLRTTTYIQINAKALATTKLYIPGLGKEGPSVFASMIPALPALFIVDREGRLAAQYAGYQPGALVGAMRTIMAEK